MKQTINLHEFRNAFERMNRKSNFSYEGLENLFNHFEEIEEATGEEIELDVISICCNYSEFENLSEFQNNYGKHYTSLRHIEDRTLVIGWKDKNSPFIVQNF